MMEKLIFLIQVPLHQAYLHTCFPAIINFVAISDPVIWLSFLSQSIKQVRLSAAERTSKCFHVFNMSNTHSVSMQLLAQQGEVSNRPISDIFKSVLYPSDTDSDS